MKASNGRMALHIIFFYQISLITLITLLIISPCKSAKVNSSHLNSTDVVDTFNFTVDGHVHNTNSLRLGDGASGKQGSFLILNATSSNASAVYKEAIALKKTEASMSSFSTEFIITLNKSSLYAEFSNADLVFAMSPVVDLEETYEDISTKGNFGVEILFKAVMEEYWWGKARDMVISFAPAGYAYGHPEFWILSGYGPVTMAVLNDQSLFDQICTDVELQLDDFVHLQVAGYYNETTDELQLGFTKCNRQTDQLEVIMPQKWSNLSHSFDPNVPTYIGFLATYGTFNISSWDFTLNPKSTPNTLNSSLYTSVLYINDTPGNSPVANIDRRSNSARRYLIGFSVVGAVLILVIAIVSAVLICRRRRTKMIHSHQIHAAPMSVSGPPTSTSIALAIAPTSMATRPSPVTNVPDTEPFYSRSVSVSSDAACWMRPVDPR